MIASLYSRYRRAARADQHRLARPVVSIGNISMGGRGKTPLAGLVARLLVEAGERPSILSRGYGREIASDGVTVVSDGQRRADGRPLADLAHSGDEPLMLARAVPGAAVLVCEDRALAGTLAERALGCTVHVLDDGFQHHRLYRDIDIVIVSDADLAGRPMPFGKLREPVETLRFADAIIRDAAAKDPTVPGFQGSGVPRFSLVRTLGHAAPRHSGPLAPWHPGIPVFAVAGIARPERFFEALAAAGYDVAGSMGFADHHRYSPADVARIRDAAARAAASAIVTTSKDMVRLERFARADDLDAPNTPAADRTPASPIPFVEIPLEVSVEPAAEFRAWLLARLGEARR